MLVGVVLSWINGELSSIHDRKKNTNDTIERIIIRTKKQTGIASILPWGIVLLCACAPIRPVVPQVGDSQELSPTKASPAINPQTLESDSKRLIIASWNIKLFGHEKKKDLELVAKVLSKYDLVAIQEVMTEEVVERLKELLVATHSVLLTDTPATAPCKSLGKTTTKEYFAFVYRNSRFGQSDKFNSFIETKDTDFCRTPYVACFGELNTPERICLMTVHIVWGDAVDLRKNEISSLDKALSWAQEQDETSSWIVLGDFNRVIDDGDRDTDPEAEWSALLEQRNLRQPIILPNWESPTTLGKTKYANAYDHIFVSKNLEDRVLKYGRTDIVEEFCDGSFSTCEVKLSDHAPVYVELMAFENESAPTSSK